MNGTYINNDHVDSIWRLSNQYDQELYNYDYDNYYNNINNIINGIINNVMNNNMNDMTNRVNVADEEIANAYEYLHEPMDIDEEPEDAIRDEVMGGEIPELDRPTCDPIDNERLLHELAHDCSICYRPMELVNLTITRCGHFFHASCLNTSMEYTPNCPYCRTQLRAIDID